MVKLHNYHNSERRKSRTRKPIAYNAPKYKTIPTKIKALNCPTFANPLLCQLKGIHCCSAHNPPPITSKATASRMRKPIQPGFGLYKPCRSNNVNSKVAFRQAPKLMARARPTCCNFQINSKFIN